MRDRKHVEGRDTSEGPSGASAAVPRDPIVLPGSSGGAPSEAPHVLLFGKKIFSRRDFLTEKFQAIDAKLSEEQFVVGRAADDPVILALKEESSRVLDEVADAIMEEGYDLEECSNLSELRVNPGQAVFGKVYISSKGEYGYRCTNGSVLVPLNDDRLGLADLPKIDDKEVLKAERLKRFLEITSDSHFPTLDKKSWPFRIKNALRNIKDTLFGLGEWTGLTLVSTNVGMTAVKAVYTIGWAAYLARVVAFPLFMAVSSAYAIQELYNTWSNPRTEHRGIRSVANLATLALTATGFAMIFGIGAFGTSVAIFLAPITLPVIALGTVLVDYFKNLAIRREVDNVAKETLKKEIKSKKEALAKSVTALLDTPRMVGLDSNPDEQRKAILRDPEVRRLMYQLYASIERRNKLDLGDKLDSQRLRIVNNMRGLGYVAFGFGLMLLSLVFPVATIPFFAIGGTLIFMGQTQVSKSRINDSQDIPSSLDKALTRAKLGSAKPEELMRDEIELVQKIQEKYVSDARGAENRGRIVDQMAKVDGRSDDLGSAPVLTTVGAAAAGDVQHGLPMNVPPRPASARAAAPTDASAAGSGDLVVGSLPPGSIPSTIGLSLPPSAGSLMRTLSAASSLPSGSPLEADTSPLLAANGGSSSDHDGQPTITIGSVPGASSPVRRVSGSIVLPPSSAAASPPNVVGAVAAAIAAVKQPASVARATTTPVVPAGDSNSDDLVALSISVDPPPAAGSGRTSPFAQVFVSFPPPKSAAGAAASPPTNATPTVASHP